MFRKEVAAGDAAAALPTAPAQSGAPAAVEPAADSWRVRLLGLNLDRITEADAIAVIVRGLKDGRGGSVVPANLDVLRKLTHRRELAVLFERADLAVADGMPLVWASRLQGTPLPERIAGSDLVWSLTAEAALRGKSVFLLGGAPGACEAAEAKLRECSPGARLAGHWCPPVGFEYDALQIQEIRRRL